MDVMQCKFLPSLENGQSKFTSNEEISKLNKSSLTKLVQIVLHWTNVVQTLKDLILKTHKRSICLNTCLSSCNANNTCLIKTHKVHNINQIERQNTKKEMKRTNSKLDLQLHIANI